MLTRALVVPLLWLPVVCLAGWTPLLDAQARPTMALTFGSAAQLTRVVSALSVRHGYPVTIPDPKDPIGLARIPNPQTRQEFVRLYLAGVAIRETQEHEQATANATVKPVTPVVID